MTRDIDRTFIEKATVIDKTETPYKRLSLHSSGICEARQGYAFASMKCCPSDGGDLRKPDQMQNPISFKKSFGDHGDLVSPLRGG
jgi:hypothetical protein